MGQGWGRAGMCLSPEGLGTGEKGRGTGTGRKGRLKGGGGRLQWRMVGVGQVLTWHGVAVGPVQHAVQEPPPPRLLQLRLQSLRV